MIKDKKRITLRKNTNKIISCNTCSRVSTYEHADNKVVSMDGLNYLQLGSQGITMCNSCLSRLQDAIVAHTKGE